MFRKALVEVVRGLLHHHRPGFYSTMEEKSYRLPPYFLYVTDMWLFTVGLIMKGKGGMTSSLWRQTLALVLGPLSEQEIEFHRKHTPEKEIKGALHF